MFHVLRVHTMVDNHNCSYYTFLHLSNCLSVNYQLRCGRSRGTYSSFQSVTEPTNYVEYPLFWLKMNQVLGSANWLGKLNHFCIYLHLQSEEKWNLCIKRSWFYIMQLTYPWWKPSIWSCVNHYMMWLSMFWGSHLILQTTTSSGESPMPPLLITSPQRSSKFPLCGNYTM